MSDQFFEVLFRKLRIGKILSHIPKNSILCDVGCGTKGTLLFDVKDTIQKGYGFDNLVESREDDKISLKKHNLDYDPIPLEDSSMDVVTALAVLEHFENPLFVLKQMHRILKPGGILLLTTPTPVSKPVLEFLAYKVHLISKREIDEHKHYFNKEELVNTLQEAGFRKENIKHRIFEICFNNFIKAVK